ncbi:MAG: mechanosensitive ion channel, partial [Gammaproteobacteria bacterium]|nr:mechanosensitive ion channel [Gammaproteobacteria bacterium]
KGVWQSAVDEEKAGTERVRGALGRAELARTADQRLDELQARIGAMIADLDARADEEERPLTRIEEHIAALNGRRAQIGLEQDQRRQTLARLEEQLRSQAESLDQLRREREQQAAAEAPADEQPETAIEAAAGDSTAQAALQAAVARRAEARMVAANLDAATLPARIERLRLELRAQQVEDAWLRMRLADVRAEHAQRSTEELRALTSGLQRLIEREPDVQQRYPEELTAMRRQIDELADVQGRVRELRRDLDDYARIEDDLTQTLANVRERLEVGGLTETLGSLFLEEQRRLRELDYTRFRLTAIERELAQSRLRSISLRERLRAAPAPDGSDADPALSELRRIRHELAAGLVQAEEALTDQLRQSEVRLRTIVSLADELDQVLRETLLWWPSHAPVGAGWADRIPAALLALLDVRAWQEIRSALHAVTLGSPGGSLLTLLAVALLYRAGRRTGRHLRVIAEKTRHRFTDSIGLTFKAIGWSIVRILPVPVLLATTSYRLEQLPEAGPGVEILAAVLFSGAIWWVAGALIVVLISRNGVGTVHFELNPCMLQRLRRHLAWYLPVQFVLIISLALAFAHPSDLVFDVLGRAALVAAGTATGFLAWRLLAPNPELEPALSDRKRRFARMAAVGAATALVVLALAGYLLTVGELFAHAIDTAVVVALVWLGYRLACRALILSEMRLRVRRTLEQRSMAAAAEAQSPDGTAAPDIPEPHLSIEDVNVQTRALVRIVAGGALVLALYWVWAEILPALIWLDGVTVWSRTIGVGEAEIMTRISLQDLLLAVFLVVVFTLAARNLPGLVEILLTRGTRMDGAARYTVTTLLRYAIMVVAIVSVFSLLGLRWSELQWLVAALTLGLGFGLQEVVANFVSGLIMLFERPVRVGDTITIGEYSGTVAKIRTRATTIIDWDNREVVVPNKMFITERLINWTLSDTMTRIVLQVGVSYDSDVDLVMQSLREIADAHPSILREPAPTVLFLKLGDSALLFELRGYVDQLRERMDTVSDLHRQIIKVFRERGIEIAFPQMDLHVRDVAPAAAPGMLGQAVPSAAAVQGPLGSI